MDSGFQELCSILCQCNLDSRLQSLLGFRIPLAVYRIPKPRIPDSTNKIFLDSEIRIPLHWAMQQLGVAIATQTERRIYHDARPNRASLLIRSE